MRRHWLCCVATGAVSLTAAPVHAHTTAPATYLVGVTAGGAVMLRTPPDGAFILGFAAQAQVPSGVRITTFTCSPNESCRSETVTAPGTLAETAGHIRLTVTHPSLGTIDLRAPAQPFGPAQLPTQSICRLGVGDETGEQTFSYTATGTGYHVRWSGRVGAGTVNTAPFGCGRHQRAGVIIASRS